MDNIPIGAIAAASSLNGSRLKVVILGEGTLCDINCRFDCERPKNAKLPNYLPVSDGKRTQGTLWTEGGVVGKAHPQSRLAVCPIERLNTACFFYQLPHSSIVMRGCRMGSEWKWEDGYTTVLAACSESPAVAGTSIVVQPSVLRVGGNSNFACFE